MSLSSLRALILIRRRHSLWAFVLALLVVSTQLGNALHAISHIGDASRSSPALSVDSEDSCALCALYAGGNSALAGTVDSMVSAPVAADVVTIATALPFVAPAHHYRSRAPPPLLAV